MKNNAHLVQFGCATTRKSQHVSGTNAGKDFDGQPVRAVALRSAGIGVGVGVGVIFRPGDNGVGVGVAVGVGVGVGLGMILVGDFGVGVGVALGVGVKSGVGETAGVGVGEELCAKARLGGKKQPAAIKSSKQTAAAIAKTSGILARRNRTTQSDAGS